MQSNLGHPQVDFLFVGQITLRSNITFLAHSVSLMARHCFLACRRANIRARANKAHVDVLGPPAGRTLVYKHVRAMGIQETSEHYFDH